MRMRAKYKHCGALYSIAVRKNDRYCLHDVEELQGDTVANQAVVTSLNSSLFSLQSTRHCKLTITTDWQQDDQLHQLQHNTDTIDNAAL